MHGHLDSAPDERSAALVLIDREIDTLSQQDRQGTLESLEAHESLEVSVRAAGEPEELAIRATPVLEDGMLHRREEARLAVLQAVAEGEPCLRGSDPRAEERRQGSEETGPDDEIGEHGASHGQRTIREIATGGDRVLDSSTSVDVGPKA
jgi:hypothetical protein